MLFVFHAERTVLEENNGKKAHPRRAGERGRARSLYKNTVISIKWINICKAFRTVPYT